MQETAAVDCSKLRWGIASAGKICNDFANALNYVGAPIAAVAARSLADAESFRMQHNVARAYSSYSDMFVDPDVEVVYIGSVNTQHLALGLQALESGKHVVCEKPLGLNLAEVEELQAAARQRNLFLLEGMWTRFFPVVKQVKALVSSGLIGDLRQVQSDFGVVIPRDVQRLYDPALGGGALLDLGIYPVATIPWMFGGEEEPLDVKVAGHRCPQAGVDLCGMLTATYANNRQAVVSWSMVSTTPEETVVSGTAGYAKIEGPAHCPRRATIHVAVGRGFEEQVLEDAQWPEDFAERVKSSTGAAEFLQNYPNGEGFVYEVRAVCAAISEGKLECDDYTWADTRRTARLMDTARRELGVKYPQDER